MKRPLNIEQAERLETLQNKVEEAEDYCKLLKITLNDELGHFATALSSLENVEEILSFEREELADRIRENNRFYEVI